MSVPHYDLVVIGSGPAARRPRSPPPSSASASRSSSAATWSAASASTPAPSRRRRCARPCCTSPASTCASCTGSRYRVKEEITVQDLLARTQHVIGREIDVVRNQLSRNHVDLHRRHGRRSSTPTRSRSAPTRATRSDSSPPTNVVIATGTRPGPARARATSTSSRIVDSDGILALETIPRSLVVVGAGVIGIEYASMFAALGTRVTVVEQRDRMLDFCDSRDRRGAAVPPARPVGDVPLRRDRRGGRDRARRGTVTVLDERQADPGRHGAVLRRPPGRDRRLDLEKAGLSADDRGRIKVDEHFRTEVEHIYAVGDVIGFPALAATSMEQGRLAAYARVRRAGEQSHAATSPSASTRSRRSASSGRPRTS